MKILKATALAATVALAFTVTTLSPAPYLGADTAHAAGKKAKKATKAKAARKGPGRCGTYMYWHKGKCNDARLGARKK